eukprot:3137788-Lingulodinium_polyedra.AAC.1
MPSREALPHRSDQQLRWDHVPVLRNSRGRFRSADCSVPRVADLVYKRCGPALIRRSNGHHVAITA